MKKINIRNLIITLLCITVIILAIGYSVLAIRLDAYKNKKESFEVLFTDVSDEGSVKGGKEEPECTTSINDDGHTLSMIYVLNNPQDEVAYTVTIKNTGTLKAKIIDIVSSPDYINDKLAINSIKPVSITKTDISGKILEPDEEATFKVLAVYNNGGIGVKKIPYKLSLITSSVE